VAESDQWTIGRLLSWTTDFLRSHGSEAPRLEAEVLLAHARGCSRVALYTAYAELADQKLRDQFRDLVKRRSKGEPVAYLVGHKEFYSLDFEVNRDVLVPRSETEHLVMAAIDWVRRRDKPSAAGKSVRIADLCTGSGCVAVAIAKHLTDASFVACDRSPKALEVARRNLRRYQLEDRVVLVESNLMEPPFPDGPFDLIVSNPPYVTTSEYNQLDPQVKDHEPREALEAGEDGLAVIRPLIAQAIGRLVPDGGLLIELSPSIAGSVLAHLQAVGGWDAIGCIKDLAGHDRIVHATARRPTPSG
jgi:release factor glutamine methyltransferase